MNTFTEPGRGRKQCNNCGVYVGVRTLVCVCGREFDERPQHTPIVEREYESPTIVERSGLQTIGTPSGPVPFRLTDLSQDGILAWVDKTKEHYRDQKLELLDEGVLYLARRLYDFQSEEYKTIVIVLT